MYRYAMYAISICREASVAHCLLIPMRAFTSALLQTCNVLRPDRINILTGQPWWRLPECALNGL